MIKQLKPWQRIDLYNVQFPDNGVKVYRLIDLAGTEIHPENWMITDEDGRKVLRLKISATEYAVAMSASAIRDFESLEGIFGSDLVDVVVATATTDNGDEYIRLFPGTITKARM